MNIKIIGTLVLILSLSIAGNYYQAQSLGVVKNDLKDALSVVESYKVAIQDLTKQNNDMAEKSKQVNLEFRETRRDLESLKNRETTVLKKKSLITLKINKAFNKSQSEMACITGDDKLCGKN